MHLTILRVPLVLVFCSVVYATNREFNCTVLREENGTSTTEVEVIHIAAKGENDTIHYLWSTFKLPSVIIARTSIDSELSVNIAKLKTFDKDAIGFSKGPSEAIGIAVSKLWQMTYSKDLSLIDNPDTITAIDLDLFEWINNSSKLECTKQFASVSSKAEHGDFIFSKNGAIKIQFNASGKEEPSVDYPHLIFNGNSTLLEFVFNELYSNKSRIRYGLQVMISSVPSNSCTWKKSTSFSVNDEDSPGVFSDVDLSSSCTGSKANSFVAWRPVAYIGEMKNIANSSDAQMIGECETIATTSPRSIAELYFEGKSEFSAFNITFGTVGDGFYEKSKFVSWSFMVGIGSAVKVKPSSAVFIFMAVGLGALVFFFFGGGAFLGCKHWCKKDDDLLLSEDSIN